MQLLRSCHSKICQLLLSEDALVFFFFWRIWERIRISPAGTKTGARLGEQVSDMSSRIFYSASTHQNPQQNNLSMHTSNQLNQWHNRHHADEPWPPQEHHTRSYRKYTRCRLHVLMWRQQTCRNEVSLLERDRQFPIRMCANNCSPT